MDLLTQLSSEHEQLSTHLRRIAAAAQMRDDRALIEAFATSESALTTNLDAHIIQEETEAFPAIDEAMGESMATHFRDEHREIQALRDSLLAATGRGEAPHAMALRLCDLLFDHQRREDEMLFPTIRGVLFEEHPQQRD